MSNVWLWLALMCPLILSPGPANLCIAGKASQSGFKSTLPLMAGFTTINIIATVSVGLLFSVITQQAPMLFKTLDLLGALYICYLGYCFFNIHASAGSQTNQSQNNLGYRSALLLQLFNGKLYPTLIMMFTVFIHSDKPPTTEILLLSFATCMLAAASYVSWSGLGTILNRVLAGTVAVFVQRYVFGGMLLLIGIKLFIEAIKL